MEFLHLPHLWSRHESFLMETAAIRSLKSVIRSPRRRGGMLEDMDIAFCC
jgi:hypothetical protein